MRYSVKQKLQVHALDGVMEKLQKDPEGNLNKVFSILEKIPMSKGYQSMIEGARELILESENWNTLYRDFFTDIDTNVQKVLVRNFVLHSNLFSEPIRLENEKKYDCNIPWAILMDPTTACNLSCVGCWAANYGNKYSMSFETLDNIVEQGKELGTYMYIFSGGEPMVRKDDIIRLCRKHDDAVFLSFTNGTLIDEKFAQEAREVGNFIPALSIEGNELTTDSRRGQGVYQKLMDAISILRKYGLVFGASTCTTSFNTDTVASDEYFDYLHDLGVKFLWLFTYMPIGADSDVSLMVSSEQREKMYHTVRAFRKTKPMFTLDFWNDGEYVDGCIAGGRRYLHINANGDIEPCAFIHYSDSNIYEHTLLEAYQRPLFQNYRQNQPFNENMLRPCPLLDNPEKLEHMVSISLSKSTDYQDPENVSVLCNKCKHTSENWAVTADRLWQDSHSSGRTAAR